MGTDLSTLTDEELLDAEPGIVMALKIIKARLDDAERALLNAKAKDYSDYLLKFHRVEGYRLVVSQLTELKQRGKEILK